MAHHGSPIFRDVALLLQNRILPPQPLQLGMDIDGCLTRLAGITLLAQPSRQRRKANAQILRDSRRVRPLVSASRTASRRNSGVGLFPFPIEHLLVPQLVLSTFFGQVHFAS